MDLPVLNLSTFFLEGSVQILVTLVEVVQNVDWSSIIINMSLAKRFAFAPDSTAQQSSLAVYCSFAKVFLSLQMSFSYTFKLNLSSSTESKVAT